MTGGHPLAVELLEMYGSITHGDWLRFLDEEILDVLPDEHRDLLSYLAVTERPVEWSVLAEVCGLEGTPPAELLSRGLIVELEDDLWLHEAMRERLLLYQHWWWKWWYPISWLIPLPIRDFIYRFIAKRRKRWFSPPTECSF